MEVVWAKSARRVWGFGHVFDGKLYLTRDVYEEKWIQKDLVPPKKLGPAPKVEQSRPPNRLVSLPKQALNRLPNNPYAPLPPHPQPLPHTQSLHSPCHASGACATIQIMLFLYPEVLHRSFGRCARDPITLVLQQ